MNRFLHSAWGALLAAVVAALFTRGALAQTAARPEIDEIFAAWNKRDSPGCALGIYQGGRITYERGYGMASLEHDVAITPETVFYVGSLSKQFTAAAAALAIQQSRLTAGDKIRTYLPELPAYADAITVRHLVHHTSGLRDYNTLMSIAGRRGDEAFDNLTVLRISARQKKLNFEPGAEYLYSNTGYTLLALLVERATGVAFADYANAQIFQPLNMAVTHYHTDEIGTQARQVADAIIGSTFTEQKPEPRGAAGSAGDAASSSESSRSNGNAAAPADLAGSYYSDEVDATFSVVSRDGRLTLKRDSDSEPASLQAAGPDEYRFRGMTVRFIRDTNRRVEALVVDAGRVRDIRFERKSVP